MSTKNYKDGVLVNLRLYVSLAKFNGVTAKPETVARLTQIALDNGATQDEVERAISDAEKTPDGETRC